MSLASLIAEVEKLTAPSREVDLAIARAVAPNVIVMRQRDDDSGADPYTYWCYTASIDAVVALIERELPAHENADHKKSEIRLQAGDFGAQASVDRDTFSGEHRSSGIGATPAIALLAAALRALEARAG